MPCMCSHVNKADSDRTWRSFKLQNIDASQPSLTSTADLFNQHSFKVDTIVSPIQYLTPMCNMVTSVCVWILKLRTKTFFLGHSDLWPSLTPSGHLCHIWRHALKVFLRYRGQENGKKRTNPRTQWSQLLLVLRNKYLKQDNVAGSEMIYKNNKCRYTHSCPHSCHVPQHKHIPVTCVFAFQRFRSSSSILLSACREPFFSDSTDKDWCSGLMSDWSFVTWQSKIQTV